MNTKEAIKNKQRGGTMDSTITQKDWERYSANLMKLARQTGKPIITAVQMKPRSDGRTTYSSKFFDRADFVWMAQQNANYVDSWLNEEIIP